MCRWNVNDGCTVCEQAVVQLQSSEVSLFQFEQVKLSHRIVSLVSACVVCVC